MLSRTADHLFWMARYTERAENTARMLNVSYDTSLLPQSAAESQVSWQGILSISELLPAYSAKHAELTPQGVLTFMVKDADNPASIISCLAAARENARAVRGTLTTEVWETLNQTWLEASRKLKAGEFERDPSQFLEWVKYRSHQSRGVTLGTMLRDEAFHFMRLGTFLERGDNTARLLDVKFHALESEFHGDPHFQSQSQSQSQGGAQGMSQSQSQSSGRVKDQEYDFYHWSAILRSVSGFEIYRKVYRNVIQPERVAELLVLRADMPRSLHASLEEMLMTLRKVSTRPDSEALRLVGRLRADLQFGTIDEVLATGLHAYLTQYLERMHQIGHAVSQEFLIPA